MSILTPFSAPESKQINFIRSSFYVLLGVSLLIPSSFAASSAGISGLSEKPAPYLSDADLPARTPPLLELGDDFLGTGNLKPGFKLLTGAVWQPRFWLYGTQRTALQHFDNGPGESTTEWMNRLDLFGNLQLTGTERVLIGMTPLHNDADFTEILWLGVL